MAIISFQTGCQKNIVDILIKIKKEDEKQFEEGRQDFRHIEVKVPVVHASDITQVALNVKLELQIMARL